ncbi:hypothetical protein BC940DRAFT_302641 [Gongronella butleri]|nr:hypothetical protein BC940DRAFT_302641 [Gongronella butleri]
MRVSTWYILLLVALAILQCHAAVGVDRKAKSKTSLKRKGKKQVNEGHDHVIGDNDDTDDNDDNDSSDDGEEYDSCDERADAMASLLLNMLSDELDDLLDEKDQNNQTANQIKTLEQLFNDQITAMSTTQRNKRKALLEGLQSKIAKVRAAVYTETTSSTTSSTVIQSTAVTSTDIESSSTTSWASTTTST